MLFRMRGTMWGLIVDVIIERWWIKRENIIDDGIKLKRAPILIGLRDESVLLQRLLIKCQEKKLKLIYRIRYQQNRERRI